MSLCHGGYVTNQLSECQTLCSLKRPVPDLIQSHHPPAGSLVFIILNTFCLFDYLYSEPQKKLKPTLEVKMR